MPIVSYGYGLSLSDFSFLIPRGFEIALEEEPEIILEDDITITLSEDVEIVLSDDITIEES